MNKTKTKHPEWALRHKQKGTELRLINGHYYLYEVTSVYNKDKKRAQKITGKIIGKITERDGLVPSKIKKEKEDATPSKLYVREHGLSEFITNSGSEIVTGLQKSFPNHWEIILGMVYCRLGWQSALKNVPYLLDNSNIKNRLPIKNVNEKSIREVLKYCGKNRLEIINYMKEFVQKGANCLIDATEFFSKSRKISLAKKGYNKDMIYDSQISLLYLYSSTDLMPSYYRLLAGNLREVKTMQIAIKESMAENAVIVADKGFYSKENIALLKAQELSFIIPLKRNNKMIDYEQIKYIETSKQYFKYKDRYVHYATYKAENDQYFIFFDNKLREEEKTDYLNRIQTHPEDYSHESFIEKFHTLGTLTFVSNLEVSPEEIYQIYKSRAGIEQMFDSLKNTLAADAAYMQDDDMLEGWMFVNHIALQYFYLIFKKLKETTLLKKYSVNDILIYLKNIKQVAVNGQWITAESTQAVLKTLSSLDICIT